MQVIQTILVGLSVGLFFGSLWQFEIVQFRKELGEEYHLPFFIFGNKKYSVWQDFWVGMMILSYVLMFSAMVIGEMS